MNRKGHRKVNGSIDRRTLLGCERRRRRCTRTRGLQEVGRARGQAGQRDGGSAGGGDTREVVIGYVSPQTGPLAPFAAADAFIVERVVKALDAKAIVVDGKKAKFRVQRADSQSNPTKAGEVAQALISGDKVDLVVVGHTPDTTNPVGAVCEATKTPCISTCAPIGPWLRGAPYEWTYHFFWDLSDVIKVFTGMWDTIADQQGRRRAVAQ